MSSVSDKEIRDSKKGKLKKEREDSNVTKGQKEKSDESSNSKKLKVKERRKSRKDNHEKKKSKGVENPTSSNPEIHSLSTHSSDDLIEMGDGSSVSISSTQQNLNRKKGKTSFSSHSSDNFIEGLDAELLVRFFYF